MMMRVRHQGPIVQSIGNKIISIYAIFNDQSFKDTLANDMVSFKQLNPGHF